MLVVKILASNKSTVYTNAVIVLQTITGIVIAKEEPRSFLSKKGNTFLRVFMLFVQNVDL